MMIIKDIIKSYFDNRKKAVFYAGLIKKGENGQHRINKMVNAKVLKPSKNRIDLIISNSERLRDYLLNLAEREEIALILDENGLTLDNIRDIEITRLFDCNIIYQVCSNVGTLGQRSLGYLFFMPISGITALEFVMLAVIFYVGLHII